MSALLDPKIFNYVIMSLYLLNAARWAISGGTCIRCGNRSSHCGEPICLPAANGWGLFMLNIVTGRQLRAARILAGLTQKQLAKAVGVHERAARYWELKDDKAPTSTPDTLEKIETVLSEHGVIVFSTPTAGVRLAGKLPVRG
jgi:DNA-binding XRE family transcriptional regulator